MSLSSSSHLSLFGNATIESQVLTLTNQTSFLIGRALYSKVELPGHGIVFLFAPSTGINGSSSAQHLGLFNLTNNGDPSNHIFGVEFVLLRRLQRRGFLQLHQRITLTVELSSLRRLFGRSRFTDSSSFLRPKAQRSRADPNQIRLTEPRTSRGSDLRRARPPRRSLTRNASPSSEEELKQFSASFFRLPL